MSDKITIEINATARLRYVQRFEITQEEWEILRKTSSRSMNDEHLSPAVGMLNFNEVDSLDDFEVDDIFTLVNDAPAEYYEGGEDK